MSTQIKPYSLIDLEDNLKFITQSSYRISVWDVQCKIIFHQRSCSNPIILLASNWSLDGRYHLLHLMLDKNANKWALIRWEKQLNSSTTWMTIKYPFSFSSKSKCGREKKILLRIGWLIDELVGTQSNWSPLYLFQFSFF